MSRTGRITNVNPTAFRRLAIPKNTKVHSLEARQWYPFHDRRRDHGEKQQDECSEKEDRERCRGAQHRKMMDGWESSALESERRVGEGLPAMAWRALNGTR